MSRCVICDYSSELSTGPKRTVQWDDKENGYVCNVCKEEHFKLTYVGQGDYNFNLGTAGEVPILEGEEYADVSVEGLDVLEELGLEEDQR